MISFEQERINRKLAEVELEPQTRRMEEERRQDEARDADHKALFKYEEDVELHHERKRKENL